MSIDILKSGFRLPGTVYVLATGPNGLTHYNRIPDDALVIAVNQAIDIPGVHKSIWLCGDGTLPKKDWFRNATNELIHLNHSLEDHSRPTPIFSEGKLLDLYPGIPYFYMHGQSLSKQPFGCASGVLRGGATISAQAVQLAYHLGAKKIILCGVDMTGNKYFDGSKTDNKQMEWGKGEIWLAQVWFNILINYLKPVKVEVISLSKTSLNVKLVGANNAIT